jgi:hypothetical protein
MPQATAEGAKIGGIAAFLWQRIEDNAFHHWLDAF